MSEDWDNLISEFGITPNQVKQWMEYIESDDFKKVTGGIVEENNKNYYIANSDLHGKGIFANIDLNEGDLIGSSLSNNKRTLIARYANHSDNANSTLRNNNLYAKQFINKNDEILIDYREGKHGLIVLKLFLKFKRP